MTEKRLPTLEKRMSLFESNRSSWSWISLGWRCDDRTAGGAQPHQIQ